MFSTDLVGLMEPPPKMTQSGLLLENYFNLFNFSMLPTTLLHPLGETLL